MINLRELALGALLPGTAACVDSADGQAGNPPGNAVGRAVGGTTAPSTR